MLAQGTKCIGANAAFQACTHCVLFVSSEKYVYCGTCFNVSRCQRQLAITGAGTKNSIAPNTSAAAFTSQSNIAGAERLSGVFPLQSSVQNTLTPNIDQSRALARSAGIEPNQKGSTYVFFLPLFLSFPFLCWIFVGLICTRRSVCLFFSNPRRSVDAGCVSVSGCLFVYMCAYPSTFDHDFLTHD